MKSVPTDVCCETAEMRLCLDWSSRRKYSYRLSLVNSDTQPKRYQWTHQTVCYWLAPLGYLSLDFISHFYQATSKSKQFHCDFKFICSKIVLYSIYTQIKFNFFLSPEKMVFISFCKQLCSGIWYGHCYWPVIWSWFKGLTFSFSLLYFARPFVR